MPPLYDPLVTLWQNAARPLNWQAWQGLNARALARLCYRLTVELVWLEADAQAWRWRHTHRELLEVKAAMGHAQ
jgi:hypothetical protein